jgi:hypothetical protein
MRRRRSRARTTPATPRLAKASASKPRYVTRAAACKATHARVPETTLRHAHGVTHASPRSAVHFTPDMTCEATAPQARAADRCGAGVGVQSPPTRTRRRSSSPSKPPPGTRRTRKRVFFAQGLVRPRARVSPHVHERASSTRRTLQTPSRCVYPCACSVQRQTLPQSCHQGPSPDAQRWWGSDEGDGEHRATRCPRCTHTLATGGRAAYSTCTGAQPLAARHSPRGAARQLLVACVACMVFFDELDEALTVGAVSPKAALKDTKKQLYTLAMGQWTSGSSLDAVGTGVRAHRTVPCQPLRTNPSGLQGHPRVHALRRSHRVRTPPPRLVRESRRIQRQRATVMCPAPCVRW